MSMSLDSEPTDMSTIEDFASEGTEIEPNEQINVLVEMVLRIQAENKQLNDKISELQMELENYKTKYG